MKQQLDVYLIVDRDFHARSAKLRINVFNMANYEQTWRYLSFLEYLCYPEQPRIDCPGRFGFFPEFIEAINFILGYFIVFSEGTYFSKALKKRES
ncbi:MULTISPECIES: hypothetical protein [Clostridia]|uniref:hypothetical protein n=1 Tax=Clostridia TaxID=186801 RepID=UPI0011C22B09|nr:MULTISPECIES: hypothetical protein [Clostridia]